MKILQSITTPRTIGGIIGAALFFSSPFISVAGAKPSSQVNDAPKLTQQRIELPASNGMTTSITVWVPTTPHRDVEKSKANNVAKVIDLHAPNNSTPSTTVWLHK